MTVDLFTDDAFTGGECPSCGRLCRSEVAKDGHCCTGAEPAHDFNVRLTQFVNRWAFDPEKRAALRVELGELIARAIRLS